MKKKKELALSGALYPTDFVSVGSNENRMREIETVQNKDIETIKRLRAEYRNWILESGVSDFDKLEKETEYGKSLLLTNVDKNNIPKNRPSPVGPSLSFAAVFVSLLTLSTKLFGNEQKELDLVDMVLRSVACCGLSLMTFFAFLMVYHQIKTSERIDSVQLECLTALQCFDIFKSALEDVRAERIS